MDIKVLEDFLTVAREKNITKAANILNMTQPVLSRRLMGLEEELGIKLFERKGRGIVLTEDGQELKERAQKMVVLYKDMRETFDKKEMILGEIGIGCAETKSMSFMARQMAMFRKQYPNVRFNLYTATADVVKDKMENGVLNLGLLKEPVDIDKYEYMRVPERDRWGILTRKDSPLAEKETICPEDLLDEPLILPVRPGMKGEVESWFGKYSDRLNLAATGTTIIMLYSSFTCVDQWLRTCLEGRTESFKIDCIFHQSVSRRKRHVNIVLLVMQYKHLIFRIDL